MGGAAASPDDLNPKLISWRGGRASQSKARAIVSTAQMLFQCTALGRSQFSSLLSRRGTGPRFDKFARLTSDGVHAPLLFYDKWFLDPGTANRVPRTLRGSHIRELTSSF